MSSQTKRNIEPVNGYLSNSNQVFLGILLLVVGIAVYIIDRPEWQTSWLPYHITKNGPNNYLFGYLGDNLPSFIHVFSLSLITSGIIARKQIHYLFICTIWILVNTLFEVFQLDFKGTLMSFDWLESYASNGVFDYKDLLAIFLGGVMAYYTLTITKRKRNGIVKKVSS